MRFSPTLAMISLLCVGLVSAQAPESALQVKAPWIRDAPPTAPMRAGYAVLLNRGQSEIEIVAASSPDFGLVEMHETRIVNDVATMSQLMSVKIAAGADYAFHPGAAHFMLMQPRRALDSGDSTTISLILKSGEKVTATFAVGDQP